MKSEQTANRSLAATPKTPAKPVIPDYFQAMQERAVTVTIKGILGRGVRAMNRALVRGRTTIGYNPYNFNCREPFADLVRK